MELEVGLKGANIVDSEVVKDVWGTEENGVKEEDKESERIQNFGKGVGILAGRKNRHLGDL